MTAFTPIDPATATGKAADLLADVQKTLGRTPNMTKVMANSPALLKGYLALSGALAGGVLPAGVRERLAIATAEYHGCEYCLSAHTYVGANIAKVDAEELTEARHARSSDPHTAALLALSDAIVRGRGTVDDATLQTARDAGAGDAEIGEVIGHLALNVLTNYFNILAKVDNDWPAVVPARLAA
ncbi:carboxymuconolactone decarboxylase family protein [Streptomyces aurantiogriseus]|uniref:Alkyl hydroperoxide reductase AhpD n=1 Tax=Streptomyces aurantiogriseus TaxID=66870 RepID=A0A918F466_9ACTN|nr:carboxymuconolactone decarboxylase family protein [Streptomyces aurantiogriseus]GGR06006.1 alkyl hydroperoxide reductase AhpD [Streptomyces aurantiogriseus]